MESNSYPDILLTGGLSSYQSFPLVPKYSINSNLVWQPVAVAKPIVSD